MKPEGGRRAEAVSVARELVASLEDDSAPIERTLMKAQRLARLLRDPYAQAWLDHEMRGYPDDFDLREQLGPCVQYAYRFLPDSRVYTTSLPELEAQAAATFAVLNKLQAPTIGTTAANHTEAAATVAVINKMVEQIAVARNQYSSFATTFARMKSHVYRYAADTLVALEFGDKAQDIFDIARDTADEFIRSKAPKATQQLLAAEERMADGDGESLSSALTSCRRVLSTVADAVYPPSDVPRMHGGKPRKVGPEQYLNRLLAFVEDRASSASTSDILTSQLSHLASRLDAVYAKACKGVHDDVTEDEARLVLVQTYLLIAEVARFDAAATAFPLKVNRRR